MEETIQDPVLQEIVELFKKIQCFELFEYNRAPHCGYMHFTFQALDSKIRQIIQRVSNHSDYANFIWVQVSYDNDKGLLYRMSVPSDKSDFIKEKLEEIIAEQEEWIILGEKK